MAATLSTMIALGVAAPDFALRDTQGRTVSRDDFTNKPMLVMFICNHCPYVVHVADELAKLDKDYSPQGIAIVAINANDVVNYPGDSPVKMAEEKAARGYGFAYLFDADQSVAKAYTAACTPDFFLFDAQHKLAYRGQLDETRPSSNAAAHGKDLRAALDAVLHDEKPNDKQQPSIGCNIKWKPGNEPAYFRG